MTKNSELGKLGEDIACGYLVKKSYKILEQNLKEPWGELDIITKDPQKTLVFIEVKAMAKNKPCLAEQDYQLVPEDNLTQKKLRQIVRAASLYANSHPELIEQSGWRIDLIAVDIYPDDSHEVRHIENIVG